MSSSTADLVAGNNTDSEETLVQAPAPATGTVVITLDAIPDDPQDFSFGLPQTFSLDDDSDPTLPSSSQFELTPGTIPFRLGVIPAGWTLTGISCSDPDNGTTTDVSFRHAVVDLDAGETVSCTFTVTKQAPPDTTPPTLAMPADIKVDATRPAGATVSYAASASDNVDPSPSLMCSPSSGSVFPIGTTMVTCTATDDAGNSASATFRITVRGAAEQTVALIDKTLAFLDLPSLGPTLKARLISAAIALIAGNKAAACTALNLYKAAVQAAPSNQSRPLPQATDKRERPPRGGLSGRLEKPLPASYDQAMAGAIVGRTAELSDVLELLADEAGGMRALVIEGEAGIGKTTLWREGIERARVRSLPTLTAQPAQAESLLPFAALGDLLAPVLDERLPALASPLRTVLEVALQRRAAEEPAEQLAVSRATLELLSLDGDPLLLAVDDVQWLDPPSERTLEFVLRRLREQPVRLLLTRRSDVELPAPLSLGRALSYQRLHSTRLGPMTLGELDELLRRRLDLRLPRPKLVQLREVSGGNPFYALEIARSASEDGFRVPASLAAALEARLLALPAPARAAILLAAAAGQPTTSLLERAAGSNEGLELAQAGGVLTFEGTRVRFTHPLLASVAYDSATPWERREAHGRLAESFEARVERARHLAESATDPDEDVAAELEASAEIASRRGAPETAARLADAAARITPGDEEANRRRQLQAADFYIAAGDPERGRAMLEHLAAETAPGPARASILVRLADTIGESLEEPIRICEEALAEAGDDRALSAEIHMALAVFTWIAGDLARATEHTRETARIAREIGDERMEAIAVGELCNAQVVLGEAWDREAMDRALEIERRDDLPTSQMPSFQLAVISVYTDAHEVARPLLHGFLQSVTSSGDEPARATVLFRLTELELRAGNWGTALRYAREADELMQQAGIEQEQYVTRMSLATVLAHLGELDEAAEIGRSAFDLADAAGDRIVANRCAGVVGFVELSAHRPEAALEWLLPAWHELERRGTAELSISGVVQNAIEALVRIGRLDEAEAVTSFVARKGEPTARAWNEAVAARGRALVAAARGQEQGAADAIEHALVAHKGLPQPFELARTLFVQGEIERRFKHRAAARATLTRALELFDELGASRWSETAAAELARIPGRGRTSLELTETERRIAELVAEGLSNKEVAARLFVTVRTVEANLTKVYGKLGIRSRTELASRLH